MKEIPATLSFANAGVTAIVVSGVTAPELEEILKETLTRPHLILTLRALDGKVIVAQNLSGLFPTLHHPQDDVFEKLAVVSATFHAKSMENLEALIREEIAMGTPEVLKRAEEHLFMLLSEIGEMNDPEAEKRYEELSALLKDATASTSPAVLTVA